MKKSFFSASTFIVSISFLSVFACNSMLNDKVVNTSDGMEIKVDTVSIKSQLEEVANIGRYLLTLCKK